MTSYITITDAETDPEAPLTSELAKKWRDNPLAIAEQDTSVPAGLRLGIFLLGTLTTTSGTTHTLSSLNLTEYKRLYITVDGVSFSTNTVSLRLEGISISASVASAADLLQGFCIVDLDSDGAFLSIIRMTNTNGNDTTPIAGKIAVTPATTSLTFSRSLGNFDGGTIKVYGER